MSQASVFGNHNTVVQVEGNGHTVVLNGKPYLGLTRFDPPPNKRQTERDLLIPDSRAIPLVGREAELLSLRAFAGSGKDSDIKVRVLFGGGGSGKTRLALTLCDELKANWLAGFVTREAFKRFFEQANVDKWGWQQPTLLVFDYAAVHADRLTVWLRELIDRPQAPEHPLRILLLERQADPEQGWHRQVFNPGHRHSADPRDLLDPPEPVPVNPIASTQHRLALMRSVLQKVRPDLLQDARFDESVLEEQLRHTGWAGDPLYLAMAALTMTRNGNTQALSFARTDLALEVASHEQLLIENHAKASGLTPAWVQHLCACVTVVGGLERSQALSLVQTEASATGLGTGNAPGLVVDFLHHDWPDGKRVAAIGPDLIGEAFLLKTWSLQATERWQALLRLWPEHGNAITSTLVRLVQDFGKDDPSARPSAWFKALLEGNWDNADVLQRIDRMVPGETVALREVNGWIASRLRALCSEGDAPELIARRAMNLAIAAAALGQREKALTAAQEAVALYRELAAQRPDAFRPDLAMSLNNLASFLSALGQREKALTAAQEAVALYRELAAQRPDAFTPDLAKSLIVLALQHEQSVQWDEACSLATEALEVLSSAFLALPEAHVGLMMPLVRDYVRLCQAAGREPDSALLLPLLPALQTFMED